MSTNLIFDCFAFPESLFDYLRSFEIEFEQTHPIFGSIKEFFQHLIKARYITTEVETGTQRLNYKWGAKADKEVSKLAILKFVANVNRVVICDFSVYLCGFFLIGLWEKEGGIIQNAVC